MVGLTLTQLRPSLELLDKMLYLERDNDHLLTLFFMQSYSSRLRRECELSGLMKFSEDSQKF